ncbi:alpha/beta hydrolase family protein [Gordonia sp. zg691]|uniref:Alpha/beta hydrolase family protein n=1 Tax=Gordonia jinghuaiqii TaxID=2758710 RepID=A0A7D7LX20_9ACTN|nr:alpha/beta hydrolase family protein [Gordonia jinghuaiqii]MBD0861043.1 alpha/beta hydrolase family protein [Gordonia jinghuaiqii]MCR5979819.1 abhydrolase domain-containing 18 [Gordonia jinghuaiqii]QMT00794.1 alpha/beta hydrolase family protein [Gordonia jinghuaiqii]
MIDWESGAARLGLFAGVLPRAVGSSRAAGRGDPDAGIPPANCGPRMIGETAVDELFIAINSVIRDIPPIESVEDWVARCADVADEFRRLGPAGVHREPGPPRILSRDRKVFGATSFQHIDYSVDAHMPPSVAALDPYSDGIGSMRVLTRRRAGRRWLIWVHGAAQGRADDLYAFRAAHLYNKLGYDVVFPVLPAHGARRVKTVAYPGFDPLVNTVITIRAIAEIRSLITWIQSHDPADISIAGTSLGGPIAAMVASMDARISSVLAVVPMLEMHATLAHHMERGGSKGQYLATLMRSDPVRAVASITNPLSVQPVAAPERRMVVAALNDRVTSVTAAQQLHQHWGGRIHWYPGSHVGHAISTDIRHATDEFLGEPPPRPDRDAQPRRATS